MSLAPARSLGAFLKARLAVNGIQCAARSLGTLTAAGLGLLSNMGASSSFGTWRLARHASSFVARRERHCPLYLRSIRRFEHKYAARVASQARSADPEHFAVGFRGLEPQEIGLWISRLERGPA